jgi:ClpP class serine protease
MRRRYDRQGILALYPQAFFDLFVEVDSPTNETVGECAIVAIRGPLEHHDGWWADSYEAILDRVTAACASSSSTIVLKIDSPGGELFGCFDAARTIRSRCKAAGKRLVAYVEGCACSAAYALACAAEQIVTSDTAFTGSIGVLITRVDVSARDDAMGTRFALVASGKRKIDGHPHASLTEGELTAMQAQCDSLASLFFELVASLRGIDAEAIAALEAGVFHGAAAVEAGLADRVQSFDEMLAAIASGEGDPMAGEDKDKESDDETPKASAEVDEARALLEKAAEGEGPEAERARAALKALDAGGDDDEEEDDESDAAASASRSSAAPSARRGAPRVDASSAIDLAKTVDRLSKDMASIKAEKEGLERATLLAGRPDLGKDLVAQLQTMPLADARKIVDAIPKPDAPAPRKPAATATVPSTRGSGQGDAPRAEPSAATSELDRAFGLSNGQTGVRREGNAMIFETTPRTTAARKPAAPATAPEPAKGPAQ